MNAGTHGELANFIWSICNLLRGPYKRNEYRKVILPLTVLRRFDCVLAETKDAVLAENEKYGGEASSQLLEAAAGFRFYNISELNFELLLNDPNLIASNLTGYINRLLRQCTRDLRAIWIRRSTSRGWTRRTSCSRWCRSSRRSTWRPSVWTTYRWATCSRN